MTEMVNHSEAARYLGISTVTLWKLARAGEIKAYGYKLDKRKRLYKLTDLEKLKGVKEISE